MFNKLIAFSLNHRLLILVVMLLLLVFGTREMLHLPIDVLPDLSRPRVTVMTECDGMAPEEVEMLVTFPLEAVLGGTSGVEIVRGNSAEGLSTIILDFDWSTDVYLARQLVSERLQMMDGKLPEGVTPVMTPVASIMGQIAMLSVADVNAGLPEEEKKAFLAGGGKILTPMELRTLADWVVRLRLQSTVNGVSEIFVSGGELRQFQVLVRTNDMLKYDISLEDVENAIVKSNRNITGGYLTNQGANQYLVRSIGRLQTAEDLRKLVVKPSAERSVTVEQIADVEEAPAVPLGSCSSLLKDEEGKILHSEAVVLTVGKQPNADTRTVTQRVLNEADMIEKSLQTEYPGFRISCLYQQRTFIDLAIHNCIEALWLGAVLVFVVLFMFLMNIRTTLITIITIPLAVISTCLIFANFGLSINTMTLGGLAVAIGELVDDAIVDVENGLRRMREYFLRRFSGGEAEENTDFLAASGSDMHARSSESFLKGTLRVTYEASCEIRNSIVYGTFIVILVFMPLFFLSGIEGRLFIPLGLAYIFSILSSLLISLTVTPALVSILLPGLAKKMARKDMWRLKEERNVSVCEVNEKGKGDISSQKAEEESMGAASHAVSHAASHAERVGGIRDVKSTDGFVLRTMKYLAEKAIRFSLRFSGPVIVGTCGIAIIAVVAFLCLGRDFMPPFNEGVFQANVDLMPGTSLKISSEVADRLAGQFQEIEGVQSVVRKTGRAELDDHVVPVSTTELICLLDPDSERSMSEIREDLEYLISSSNLPGTVSFYDQPLQHVIAHLRSGVYAKIAVKIQGDNLEELRRRANRVKELMAPIEGIGNVRITPIQSEIPQVRVELDRDKLAFYGLTPDDVNNTVELAMKGRVITEMLEGQRSFGVMLRLADEWREDQDAFRHLPITLPDGSGIIPLESVTSLIDFHARGPSQIEHEGARRQLIVQCSPPKRSSVDVVREIEAVLEPHMEELSEHNYSVQLTGLFESERQASRRILLLSVLSLIGIFLVLYTMFHSVNLALQVMVALPMALIGAVAAIYLTGQLRTIPCLVGMISLCGIASRNGILLIDHYFHLVRYEGKKWSKDLLVQAGRDRVAPVLMTALTSGVGLLPLTFHPEMPGREILYPIAVVMIGGLLSSTFMEFFVRPALFWKFWVKKHQEISEKDVKTESEVPDVLCAETHVFEK
ncbi:MAG: efflux RND transporter permease subunit [Planctomycetia bacterium]|nr:efflux RND transporter permease subunit [Planctomycetia bacterium]